MRLQLISRSAVALLSVSSLAVSSLAPRSAAAQSSSPEWRLAADALYYTDTDNVTAVSPSLSVRRRLDGGGWVGVRGAVDVVSAASVDVISHATTGFEEVRSEGSFDLSVPAGDVTVSSAYRFSYEPDYLSNGLSLGLQFRLGSPDTVLSINYRLSWDVVSRVHTSWEAFSEDLFTHGAALSLTQNLGSETVLRLVYAPMVQHGFLEKPYRYVPLFGPAGQRLANRIPENVPDLRHGHALGVRLLQYLEPIDGSVRLDYQFYAGSWGVTSHIVEVVGLASVVDGFRLGLRGRVYGQTAASFWQRTYTIEQVGHVPRWRSLNRDLSPYYALTGAARMEWNTGEFSGHIDGAVTLTRFEDFLLLDERVAIVTQIGLRWTP